MHPSGLQVDFVRILASLTALLTLLVVAESAHARRDTKTEFKVNESQSALTTNTVSECAGGEPGCKEARRNQKLLLQMRLDRRGRDCTRAPRAKWQLQAVYLGGYNSATKPAVSGNLPAHVKDDFDVDLASGLVIPQSKSETKIDFFNNNLKDYTVWYKVTAVCVDREGVTHGSPIASDPRIVNRGTGVN